MTTTRSGYAFSFVYNRINNIDGKYKMGHKVRAGNISIQNLSDMYYFKE